MCVRAYTRCGVSTVSHRTCPRQLQEEAGKLPWTIETFMVGPSHSAHHHFSMYTTAVYPSRRVNTIKTEAKSFVIPNLVLGLRLVPRAVPRRWTMILSRLVWCEPVGRPCQKLSKHDVASFGRALVNGQLVHLVHVGVCHQKVLRVFVESPCGWLAEGLRSVSHVQPQPPCV